MGSWVGLNDLEFKRLETTHKAEFYTYQTRTQPVWGFRSTHGLWVGRLDRVTRVDGQP